MKDLTSAGKRSEKSGNSSLLGGLVEVKNYEHLSTEDMCRCAHDGTQILLHTLESDGGPIAARSQESLVWKSDLEGIDERWTKDGLGQKSRHTTWFSVSQRRTKYV